MIALPQGFCERMQALLGAEYEPFAASYANQERIQGLRVNLCKLSAAKLLQKSPFPLEPVPWAPEGFYYPQDARPGKHPYHEAGLYYIQEPSAMSAAVLLDAQPGERVLDLCAAPGGKSTQIAARMQGVGLLVSNEFSPVRARALSQNIERMGIAHTLVTNETPERLAQRMPAYFDRVLVDAPCSGEGMFRKEPEALAQWSLENIRRCAQRQQDILQAAAQLLRPGGRLVYSTCTFAPEENEGTISRFLERFSDFTVEQVQACSLFSPGRPDWVQQGDARTAATFRLMPHRLQGEGHYVAVLRKAGDGVRANLPQQPAANPKQLEAYRQFAQETLQELPKDRLLLFGEQLYQMPEGMPELDGLRVLRPGLHLGTLKKGRFEPSHAWALALTQQKVRRTHNLAADSAQVQSYLRGETLDCAGEKGWTLVTVDGFALGWGKQSAGQLKNHFPKGLRWKGSL